MEGKISNPFITIGEIPPAYFCDRVKETATMIRTLTNGSNLVLMSPRRMGKSKLVKHFFCQPEIETEYYTFYIDLLHSTSMRELTYAFGKSVFEQVKSRGEKTVLSLVQALRSMAGTFGFDAVTNLPTFTLELGRLSNPEFTLQEIFGWLESADKPCLVCFDEFQKVNQYADNRDGRVEALLRSHIQHLGNVNFIFSGSEQHLLAEMFCSQAKPFYNSANLLTLKAIDRNVYIDFACHWFEAYGKAVDGNAIGQYYDRLEGTTYYLQKLMHEAFIDCAVGETCDETNLNRTFANMQEENYETYMKLLGELTERNKETLFAIAREGRAQKVLSVAFIKKYALASPSVVQTSLRKLLADGLVARIDDEYFVADVFFRLFLQEYPKRV